MASKSPKRPRAPRDVIDLAGRVWIQIVHEDRSILAIDKPVGWILAPKHWENTGRNLTLALDSSLAAREFWASSRNIRFIRAVHRLDADTSGVMLLARSPGALTVFSKMFESREIEKIYWAIVEGTPKKTEWECNLKLGPHPTRMGVMRVDPHEGKEAITKFKVLESRDGVSLVEARPLTGRTHQIRVHLYSSGHPIMSDPLYGMMPKDERPLALRAVGMRYNDPFSKRPVRINANSDEFLGAWGFKAPTSSPSPASPEIVTEQPVVEAPKPAAPKPVVFKTAPQTAKSGYKFSSGPRPKPAVRSEEARRDLRESPAKPRPQGRPSFQKGQPARRNPRSSP